MRAILCREPGDEQVMQMGEAPRPELGPGGVRIRVAATAVNRADLLQRQGRYPPPPGASPILGLECAGVVAEVGPGVDGLAAGDRVMALLAGGGYAEEAVAHAGCVLRVPDALSLEEAAAIPEAFVTAYLNLFEIGGIAAGRAALVHGGGSGVGTAAIQLCREAGAPVVVTVGSASKAARCLALGAARAVDYRTEDFVAAARAATGGRGVHVVLDHVGGPYLARNLDVLATDGRLVQIGLMVGAEATFALAPLLARRLSIHGSTLRSRPAQAKAAIIDRFWHRFGAAFESGRIRPVVDRVLPLHDAPEAHRVMKASEHFGKIVLCVDDAA